MKKSHIALLSALGVGLLIILTGLILGRAAVGHGREWKSETGSFHVSLPSGDYTDKSYDLDDFRVIVVEGLWEISIRADEDYSVDVTIPDSWVGGEVFTSGDRIVFGRPVNEHNADESATAIVTMPSLDGVSVTGAASVTFDGFDSDSLDLTIEGAAQIRALNSSAEDVSVEVAGVGQVDLMDLVTVNARVILDGAGEVKLNMDGGVISGRIDGVGRVAYTGSVKETDVTIDGMGRVRRLD